jgi:hypothetical protein
MKQESQGSKQGNDIYERLANFCNKEISVGILGQTMTLNLVVHILNQKFMPIQRMTSNASDRRFVERILNELIVPLLQKQGFDVPDGGSFHAADIEEELSSKDQLDMDLRIHKEVAPLPLEHFTEKYNVKFDLQAKKEKDKQKEQAQKQQQQPVKLSDVKRKINLADRVSFVPLRFFPISPDVTDNIGAEINLMYGRTCTAHQSSWLMTFANSSRIELLFLLCLLSKRH